MDRVLQVFYGRSLHAQSEALARMVTMAKTKGVGPYILLQDQTVEISSEALTQLVRYLDLHSEIGAVGPILTDPTGTVLSAGGMLYQDGTVSHYEWGAADWREIKTPENVPFLSLTCLLLRAQALSGLTRAEWDGWTIGQFADVHMGCRIRERGYGLRVITARAICGTTLINRLSWWEQRRFLDQWGPMAALGPVNIPGAARAAADIQRPRSTSLVMLCWNNRMLTQQAIESILAAGDLFDEFIVVDNGSTDDTFACLEGFQRRDPRINPVRLAKNCGFAGGVNAGLRQASGDVVAILNNDILVGAGWLNRLRSYLTLPGVHGVGPVANRVSGVQNVEMNGPVNVDAVARERVVEWAGRYGLVTRLVGFCLLMTRTAIDRAGGFDVRFGLGNFEDDDWSRRMNQAGFHLAVAFDVFVGHVGGAGFRLHGPDVYRDLLERNRNLYEAKWRENSGTYAAMVEKATVRQYLTEAERLYSAGRKTQAVLALEEGIARVSSRTKGYTRLVAQREVWSRRMNNDD